jgi:hypothetical protein
MHKKLHSMLMKQIVFVSPLQSSHIKYYYGIAMLSLWLKEYLKWHIPYHWGLTLIVYILVWLSASFSPRDFPQTRFGLYLHLWVTESKGHYNNLTNELKHFHKFHARYHPQDPHTSHQLHYRSFERWENEVRKQQGTKRPATKHQKLSISTVAQS